MRMPDVMGSSKSELSKEEWAYLQKLLGEALEKLEGFRAQEGDSIAKDYEERLVAIEESMAGIAPHEEARLAAVRERLMNSALYFAMSGFTKTR